MSDKKAVELLFQRPLEPVFTTRDNGKTALDVPDNYYTKTYSNIDINVVNRFGDDVPQKIPMCTLDKIPNLDFAKAIGKTTPFSLFNNKHTEIAGKLIEIFLKAKDLATFASTAAYCKDPLNPVLFQYCLSVAVAHREDTEDIFIPPVVETFPSNFVEPNVLKEARAQAFLVKDAEKRQVIEIPENYTASDSEMEQRLYYFREDIGVNMHHWHWHLVYPHKGPDEVVNKDRRGELFYYMHHQILARYNTERFCNNLSKVVPLNNLREPVPEGYFPKMLCSSNNRTYPSRPSNTHLRDLFRSNNGVEISELERWRDRIFDAIDQGYAIDSNGQRIPLDEVRGIDILGNIIEGSQLNINPRFYGSYHNMGHDLISYVHDPDNRHLEDFAVMGDNTTAMRDPIFYRWHSYIDTIFNKFKTSFAPYDMSHLGFDGISVDHIEVKTNRKGAEIPNKLLTYKQKSEIDLAAGIDFGPNGNILAKFTHLAHAAFEYEINAKNNTRAMKKGTCRIFICPKNDERGVALNLEEQRLLAIEMDKFTVDCKC